VLRRRQLPAAGSGVESHQPDATGRHSLQLFDLLIDLAAREASRAGAAIPLTRVELDLLATLAAAPGTVFTRDQLGAAVFGESFDAFDRTIDSHVKNLRRKLGGRSDGGQYVETVRGVGYRAARMGAAG
jgi:DNA-binding response OmpR family regulator